MRSTLLTRERVKSCAPANDISDYVCTKTALAVLIFDTECYNTISTHWRKLFFQDSGPIFCLLFGVGSDYAQPITGQVTEVTCPVIGRALPELTPSKRKKTGPEEHWCWCNGMAPSHSLGLFRSYERINTVFPTNYEDCLCFAVFRCILVPIDIWYQYL